MEISLDTLVDELLVFRRAYLDTKGKHQKIQSDAGLEKELKQVESYIERDSPGGNPYIENIEFANIRSTGFANKLRKCIYVNKACRGGGLLDDRPFVYPIIAHEALHFWGVPSKRRFLFSGVGKETATELYGFEISARIAFDGDKNYECGLYDCLSTRLFQVTAIKANSSGKPEWFVEKMAPLYSRDELDDAIENAYLFEKKGIVSKYLETPYLLMKNALGREDKGVVNKKNQFMFGIPNLTEFWNRAMEKYGNPA